ncbi:competence protein ComK [Bacillus sp. KH172YL63]|uniref:competence protein ComK n=1 Tax=Bacillus sp. KH172YL63 TaxID=2709784 RepID=UPI0013E50349|nr:competence protein ComK [Bacillus sp. KH172YL63]BCB05803.1 competence protein [Bacillus sp. KH172YL63]
MFGLKDLEVLVTCRTVAVGPAYDGIHQSIVYDYSGRKWYSKRSVMDILDSSCMIYRSTYDGRIKAVRHAFDYFRKTPLMLCPQQFIYAIPTVAPTQYDCIWLFCQHIESSSSSEDKTYVHFTNGERMEINCSQKVFTKQRERAAAAMNHFSTIPNLSHQKRHDTALFFPGFQSGIMDTTEIGEDTFFDH